MTSKREYYKREGFNTHLLAENRQAVEVAAELLAFVGQWLHVARQLVPALGLERLAFLVAAAEGLVSVLVSPGQLLVRDLAALVVLRALMCS